MSLDELRALLSDDLKKAMKAGRGREVSALRAFMTALDNSTAQSQATVPRGATEAPRREPSPAEMAAVLRQQIEERAAAIETYSRLRMETRLRASTPRSPPWSAIESAFDSAPHQGSTMKAPTMGWMVQKNW
jgi:predicted ATPase